MLDEIDKILISELQKNGRTALSHISKKVGISHVAVRKRLEKLLKEEMVSISADLNMEALGAKIAALVVEVENFTRLKELMNLFRDCPRTVFLSGLSASNLLTIVIGENLSTLESVIGVCSVRVQKGVRRSEVHIGSLPTYPRFLPIRITPRKEAEIAPCGAKCEGCWSLKNSQCLGCPSTKFYSGPL
ncbi:MAG: AsnC family transcriptional regulator [Candidatus Bathyarchaeia archaeon]